MAISEELLAKLKGDVNSLNKDIKEKDLKEYLDKSVFEVSDINSLYKRGIDGKLVRQLQGDVNKLNKDIIWHDVDCYIDKGIYKVEDANFLHERGISGNIVNGSALGGKAILKLAADLKKEDVEKYSIVGDTKNIEIISKLIKKKISMNFIKACRRKAPGNFATSKWWATIEDIANGDLTPNGWSSFGEAGSQNRIFHEGVNLDAVAKTIKKEHESIEEEQRSVPLNKNISEKELASFEEAGVYKNEDINKVYEKGIKGDVLDNFIRQSRSSRGDLVSIASKLSSSEELEKYRKALKKYTSEEWNVLKSILNLKKLNISVEYLQKCTDVKIDNLEIVEYLKKKKVPDNDLVGIGEYLKLFFPEVKYLNKRDYENIENILKLVQEKFLVKDFLTYSKIFPKDINISDIDVAFNNIHRIKELGVKLNDTNSIKILQDYGIWSVYHIKEFELRKNYTISRIPELQELLYEVFFAEDDKTKKVGENRSVGKDSSNYLPTLFLGIKRKERKANKIKNFCENNSDIKNYPGFTLAQKYYCYQYGISNEHDNIKEIEAALKHSYEKNDPTYATDKDDLRRVLTKVNTGKKVLVIDKGKMKKDNPKVFMGVKKSKLKYVLITQKLDETRYEDENYESYYGEDVKISKKEIEAAIKEAKSKGCFMKLKDNPEKKVLILRFPRTPDNVILKIKKNADFSKYGVDKIIIFTKDKTESVKCNATNITKKSKNDTNKLLTALNDKELTVVHFVGQNNKLAEILE